MSREEILRRIKKSRQQERQTARDVRGRVQPLSGAMRNPALKEDVVSNHFLVSNKTTDKGSYTIKLKEMLRLEDHALGMSKCPLLQTDIQGQRWVTVRWEDFIAIMQSAGMQ